MVKGESLVSGDFGEGFVAYLLAKQGVDVVRAKTMGFDIFAIDHTGALFEKDKTVGVSVKTRISKHHARYVPTVPVGSRQISEAALIWKVEPWLAIVVGSIGQKLACFLLPFKEHQKFTGHATRKDVLAVSELYSDTTRIVKRLW